MKKIKSLCFVALCLYMTACQKNNDKSQVFNSEASNQIVQQEITQASEFTEETEPLISDAPEALSQEELDKAKESIPEPVEEPEEDDLEEEEFDDGYDSLDDIDDSDIVILDGDTGKPSY